MYAAKEFNTWKSELNVQAVTEIMILQKIKHVNVAAHKNSSIFLTHCTEAHCELCELYWQWWKISSDDKIYVFEQSNRAEWELEDILEENENHFLSDTSSSWISAQSKEDHSS